MANPAKILERGTDGVAFEALIPASQPGDVFPAGTIVDYAGAAAPTGWLICDGSLVSRATYPNLFTNIGTTFGAGDGSTTFGIPDLRGKIPVGKHTGGTFQTLGATGGEENHTLSVAEIPSHNHGGASGTAAPNTGAESASHTHNISQTVWGLGSARTTAVSGEGTSGPGATALGSLVSGSTAASNNHTHAVASHAHTISSQGGGGVHNNMPPYVVLNKIIRAY